MITAKYIKLEHDDFIDSVYGLYLTLLDLGAFTHSGLENDDFKMWKYDDNYYILDKSSGLIVTWSTLLGYHLKSNEYLCKNKWKKLCDNIWSSLDKSTERLIKTTEETKDV